MIPQKQTPSEYYAYDTPEESFYWGDYQFIGLNDVLDDILIETTDSDSYLKNTRRSRIIAIARAGIRTLNQTIKNNVHAIEMDLYQGLSIPLPQDYVDWVRVSVLDDNFKLRPLNINNRIPTYTAYLQDNNAEILFDNDGHILQSNGANAYVFPFKSYLLDNSCYCNSSGNITDISVYGEAKIDEANGTVVFSSNIDGKLVVFEYISDGLIGELHGQPIKIHKHLVEPLKAYIYARAIATKRNVPANEKHRANEYYKGLRHKALVTSQNFNIPEISRIMDKR